MGDGLARTNRFGDEIRVGEVYEIASEEVMDDRRTSDGLHPGLNHNMVRMVGQSVLVSRFTPYGYARVAENPYSWHVDWLIPVPQVPDDLSEQMDAMF